MPIDKLSSPTQAFVSASTPARQGRENSLLGAGRDERSELRETFNQFVGETFFGQLLGALRKSVGRPAYFHGGQAEEIFQGQLDQMLAQRMAEASSATFADPMFELFTLSRLS